MHVFRSLSSCWWQLACLRVYPGRPTTRRQQWVLAFTPRTISCGALSLCVTDTLQVPRLLFYIATGLSESDHFSCLFYHSVKEISGHINVRTTKNQNATQHIYIWKLPVGGINYIALDCSYSPTQCSGHFSFICSHYQLIGLFQVYFSCSRTLLWIWTNHCLVAWQPAWAVIMTGRVTSSRGHRVVVTLLAG